MFPLKYWNNIWLICSTQVIINQGNFEKKDNESSFFSRFLVTLMTMLRITRNGSRTIFSVDSSNVLNFECIFSWRYGDKTPKSVIARLFAVGWIMIGVTLCSLLVATLSRALTSVTVERFGVVARIKVRTKCNENFISCRLDVSDVLTGEQGWRGGDSTLHATRQCGPRSNPGVDTIYGLSLSLLLFLVPRGFSPGRSFSPSP